MKKKTAISIILLMMMVIPVFATKYNDNLLVENNILYPGTEIEEFNEYPLQIYYCDLNNNCSYTPTKSIKIYDLEEYNKENSNQITDTNNNNKFIGWKVKKVSYERNTTNNEKNIYLEPYYGVEHKITKQPTENSPTVEVTESNQVKEYNWYQINDNSSLRKYSFSKENIEQYLTNNVWKYEEDINQYSTLSENDARLKGYIEIEKDSKIIITYPMYYNYQQVNGKISDLILYNLVLSENTSIYGYDIGTGIGNSSSKINHSINCDEKTKICTEEYDLSTLATDKNKYAINIVAKRNFSDESLKKIVTTIKFQNIKAYVKSFNLLENEKTKTLENMSKNNKYFVTIKYNDGTLLISDTFKIESEQNPAISEEISDIVANPLTGDNLIYTLLLAIFSTASIIVLSKKLKSN